MAGCRASVEIEASPERVFPYLYEPEKLVLWIESLVEAEPPPAGVPRVGDRTRVVNRTRGGRRRETIEETIAVEPDRLFVSLVEQREFDGRGRFELESVDGRTRLNVTCDYT